MPKLFVSNKDESARLFKSDFLELFTHVHWSVPLIIFVPVVVYSLYVTISGGIVGLGAGVSLFLIGGFVWTLTEYLLHRFAFHYQPKSVWGQRIHFLTHGVHHDYPNDTKRLVMVPTISIPLAAAFYIAFGLILGFHYVPPFFAGFILGYIAYDEIHYATHHAPFKSGVFLYLKQHHIRHHYGNPDRGYGVSSPLWDHVFGTLDEKEKAGESGSSATA